MQAMGRPGTWEVSPSPPETRHTDCRHTNASRPRGRPTPAGANRAHAWYRQAKATKCGGMGGEKSEFADTTAEVGEPAPRDPAEGSGGPDHGLSSGQTAWTSGHKPSQRKPGS